MYAIICSLFIHWGITKFTFRAYIVQFDGDSDDLTEFESPSNCTIYIYIYIYIVIHRQTVSFYQNSLVWLDI